MFLRALTGYWLYDLKTHKFINGVPDEVFSVAFDGTKFVKLTYDYRTRRYTTNT